MSKTVLITGANRGIGYQFACQYAEDGWKVHACCRNPDNAGQLRNSLEGKDATIHPLDVADQSSIDQLKSVLTGKPIDILLNNAGAGGGDNQSFGNINYTEWEATLRTNTIGPYRMFEAFHENLLAGTDKKVIMISSKMGSIERYTSGDDYDYRSSKTALNMVMVNLDYEFRSQGICFLSFHPGWVQTDMGGQEADISPSHSASSMRACIEGATLDMSSSFLNYDGAVLPW